MMDQILVFGTLGLALVFFIWGRIRYDLVALSALFFLVLVGVIAPEEAFTGFAHTAVITVAAVMIIGEGMLSSGLIDIVADDWGHHADLYVALQCGQQRCDGCADGAHRAQDSRRTAAFPGCLPDGNSVGSLFCFSYPHRSSVKHFSDGARRLPI